MHARTLGRELQVSVLGMRAVGLSFGWGPAAPAPRAWRQVAKLESTRGIRLPLKNDRAANVHGHVRKRAARLVE